MKFTLTYEGRLSASGNKPKPEEAYAIRNDLHAQLLNLWETHAVLRRLRHSARHYPEFKSFIAVQEPLATDYSTPPPPLDKGQVDLCEVQTAGNGDVFLPLVRKSLDTACGLEILFLRQEDPGNLVLQGGDIDNRLKTLFDALRIPKGDELGRGTPIARPLCCLLESDTLISEFSIRTDRLLGAPNQPANYVKLVVGVTVKVLHVNQLNLALVSD